MGPASRYTKIARVKRGHRGNLICDRGLGLSEALQRALPLEYSLYKRSLGDLTEVGDRCTCKMPEPVKGIHRSDQMKQLGDVVGGWMPSTRHKTRPLPHELADVNQGALLQDRKERCMEL